MKPIYKSPFGKFVKKQSGPFQMVIEDAVEFVCEHPRLGEAKTGDLQGIRVYKFTHNRQQYLIAYRPLAEEDLKAGRRRDRALVYCFLSSRDA